MQAQSGHLRAYGQIGQSERGNKLRDRAQKKFADDECDVPAVTLKVDFIALGQTEEYRQYEKLEALFLYDRVRVRHPDIHIDVLCEVKRMEFDCLTGRPKKIELGKVKLLSQMQPIAKWQLPSGINAQSKLAKGSVTDAHLAEGSVNDTHLTDESVLEHHILDGSVSPAKLKVGFFEADVIRAALATIVVANITTANIQNANIDWAAIANLTTQMATIAQAQINSAEINWANIESLNATIATIASAQISSAKIAEANIDWASIANLNAAIAEIARAQINTATIEHANIDWASISNLSAQIASMVNAQILNAVIDTAQIRDGSIVSAKIADAAITTAKIRAASITSMQIALGAITTALIDSGAVGTAQIMDGSITDAKIVELTANKINAGTLSVERLIITGSDQSIVYEINCANGTAQLSQTTIDGGALTQRSVTADRIVAQAITADELAAASVIANKIAAGAVEADKIAANAVTAGKIAAGAVTVDKLASNVGNALDISSNEAILSRVSQAQYDGERVYTQDEPPAAPALNMKWLDTGGDSPVLKMYDGSEWVVVGDGAAELEQLSTSITQTSEQITQMVSKADMSRYLSFSAQNGVLIGDNASSYRVQILSDRVNILQNGAVIAYFASSKLFITEGELTSSLTIGNYTLKKTTDGGIAIG